VCLMMDLLIRVKKNADTIGVNVMKNHLIDGNAQIFASKLRKGGLNMSKTERQQSKRVTI